jgi:error-prone DNA polymerase
MRELVKLRGNGYRDIPGLWQRAGLSLSTLETLAKADAFRSIGLDRRQALWEVKALADRPSALAEEQHILEPVVSLPVMRPSEHVVQDYAATSFSLKGHPVGFLRPKLEKMKAVPAKRIWDIKPGTPVKLAGIVLVRQQPPTASGVVFVTVEDETGVANLIVFNDVYKKFRKELLAARLLLVEGKLERESDVIHIVAKSLCDLTPWLKDLSKPLETEMPLFTTSRDEAATIKSIPEARNFR